MLDKREEFSIKFALLLELIRSVNTTRDRLTYDMTNCLKAIENSLNKIIGDIIVGLQ